MGGGLEQSQDVQSQQDCTYCLRQRTRMSLNSPVVNIRTYRCRNHNRSSNSPFSLLPSLPISSNSSLSPPIPSSLLQFHHLSPPILPLSLSSHPLLSILQFPLSLSGPLLLYIPYSLLQSPPPYSAHHLISPPISPLSPPIPYFLLLYPR